MASHGSYFGGQCGLDGGNVSMGVNFDISKNPSQAHWHLLPASSGSDLELLATSLTPCLPVCGNVPCHDDSGLHLSHHKQTPIKYFLLCVHDISSYQRNTKALLVSFASTWEKCPVPVGIGIGIKHWTIPPRPNPHTAWTVTISKEMYYWKKYKLVKYVKRARLLCSFLYMNHRYKDKS